MGLFRNQSRRDSGDIRWLFKPVDPAAQSRSRSEKKRETIVICKPVMNESIKELVQFPDMPHTAPLPKQRARSMSSHEHPYNFEPLFQDDYVSPVEERVPFELSAASAARFHDYLQDLNSGHPSPENTDHEEDDVAVFDNCEGLIATTVALASPGRPKVINLSSASSIRSSRSADSSFSNERTSGFLHSRSGSEDSSCDTTFMPATLFDSSEDSPPAGEKEMVQEVQYNVKLKKIVSKVPSMPGRWAVTNVT